MFRGLPWDLTSICFLSMLEIVCHLHVACVQIIKKGFHYCSMRGEQGRDPSNHRSKHNQLTFGENINNLDDFRKKMISFLTLIIHDHIDCLWNYKHLLKLGYSSTTQRTSKWLIGQGPSLNLSNSLSSPLWVRAIPLFMITSTPSQWHQDDIVSLPLYTSTNTTLCN
jgi:hypothetical protein